MKRWIEAARLRTLPLTLACILLGNSVAYSNGNFDLLIFVLSMVTALLLQIIANFANDLGDAQKGTDDNTRVGPKRMVSLGLISQRDMFIGITVAIVMSCCTGLWLIFRSFSEDWWNFFIFSVFGALSIIAALCYTLGKHAYGYYGLGDLFSFLFFGILGVVGSYYLQSHNNYSSLFWLGSAHGCLVAAVMNVNNMRDFEGDKLKNKRTMVVILGEKFATIYHSALIIISMFLYMYYTFACHRYTCLLFLLGYPVLFYSLFKVIFRKERNYNIDPELKRTSIGALSVGVLFSVGLII